MKWGKSICLVALTSLVILTIVGCGKSEERATTPSNAIGADTTTSPTTVAPSNGRPSAPMMDLAAAVAKLGITEERLRDALGTNTQKPQDLAVAASSLGITEEALREALGFQSGTQFPGDGGARQPMPAIDLAATAAKLGITEQQLKEALGNDAQGTFDLATAASKLGITEEALREALGFPGGSFREGTPPTSTSTTGSP